MQRLRRILLALMPIMFLVFVWTQRYDLLDWWRLRDYTPPARIAQLADDNSMTDYGRKLFYVNHPELNDKIEFGRNCRIGEESIVLGCYVSNSGIYLFEVSDPRLQGVEQVTAAHEMLHAAYQRLNRSDRSKVDKLTAQTFANIKSERLRQTVESYRQRDSEVVPNELHSILATEVEELPSELEAYYSRYFNDRKSVVRYSQQYEAAFQERKDKVAAYDRQLTSLRDQIQTRRDSLDSQQAELESGRTRLDQLRAEGRQQEYNQEAAAFNERVRRYNATVGQLQTLIDTYNRVVDERNAVAIEENELVEAIDSRPSTIQTR